MGDDNKLNGGDEPLVHCITVCIKCQHRNTNCHPGFALIERLRAAINAAGDSVGADFQISGIACMAGCERPCTVAYQANRKASYLFGDIEPDQDINNLVAFAHQYAALEDGWCNATERPAGLIDKTLARLPAAGLVSEVRRDGNR